MKLLSEYCEGDRAPTHGHDWIDVTAIGSEPVQEMCGACGAFRWRPLVKEEVMADG